MPDTILAALIAGCSALFGVFFSSIVSLFVAWVNDKRERKKLILQWSEEKRQKDEEKKFREIDKIESYVLKRLSMIQNLSEPLEHRQVLKDIFISEHIRLVGESLYSKQTLIIWGERDLGRNISEIEDLFYKTWEKRMLRDGVQDFDDALRKMEELSMSVLTGLYKISNKNRYSLSE